MKLAGVPDAVVTRVAALPETFEGAQLVGRYMQIRPGTMLLRVPEVGAFLVEDGKTIQIAPEPDADPGAVTLYLHGAARAALLYQRGDFPLHASSVVPPGGGAAIALCGVSGAGKSTLAVEMHRRGWTVIADDTTRITLPKGTEGADPALAWPSDRGVKLWQDACELFSLAPDGMEHVRQEVKKFYYPVTAGEEPVPLGAVIELSTSSHGLSRIEGLPQRMALLSSHAFRQRQVPALGMMEHHLKLVGTLATKLVCARLGGARQLTVGELGDRVEEVARWIHPSS